MPGVPGRGGKAPKRASERRRRNKVDIDTIEMEGDVEQPDIDSGWHSIAVDWYKSLADSGQSKFFEPSDWAAARLVAHDMTRHLANRRPSSQWFAAVWSAMNDLLTTEAHRRRVRMEIERKSPKAEGDQGELATVTPIDRYSIL